MTETIVPRAARRRGRHKGAAWLGFFVLLLAFLLLASAVFLIVRGLVTRQRQKDLEAQVQEFLYPLMLQNPSPFDTAEGQQQDALILSALWRIARAETDRLQRRPGTVTQYETDEWGRWSLPISEVSAAYAALFGTAQPYFHTIGDPGTAQAYEYSLSRNCYYVPPGDEVRSAYVPVLGRVTREGGVITAQVGYVRSDEPTPDRAGAADPTAPSMEQAAYTQLYTITETDAGWVLTSVSNEQGEK
ncbi:MAG: hypothetical protein IKI50_05100 [Clostridia bacterium]|nr:hypothetical protein [Clostridia bacterium]